MSYSVAPILSFYLVMILDDYSRMIVGGRLFYQDNAANFQLFLREAVATYRIPHKLYVDNSAPYSNEQLAFICGSVGAIPLHPPVRDGASKSKVERNFRTLKERWLYGIDLNSLFSNLTLQRIPEIWHWDSHDERNPCSS